MLVIPLIIKKNNKLKNGEKIFLLVLGIMIAIVCVAVVF